MRIPTWSVPPLIVCCFFAVIAVGKTWELPTMTHEFASTAPAGEEKEVQMIVEGLRCRGTSNFLVARLQSMPGIRGVETFVQEHRAIILFDAGILTVDQIRQKIEEPYRDEDGSEFTVFTVAEVK